MNEQLSGLSASLLCGRPMVGDTPHVMVGCSLTAHLTEMEFWSLHWGDRGGKERNWLPYHTKPMTQDECLH